MVNRIPHDPAWWADINRQINAAPDIMEDYTHTHLPLPPAPMTEEQKREAELQARILANVRATIAKELPAAVAVVLRRKGAKR